ncbi:50S ribosomal protein L2 [Candidatus Falkowbacteria bacterium RIFOXYD2_FULL_35_9]|uniref:Large ribosomal subunit protein uL2 n=1 Tax=Candidatus Falkowbacteria bacterium RIFOXYC2_FULL_36_12 TaxID=1798002 RepID=A0A1F5SW71_9BACT|nr:MAG: 50S ribosomal protein L2 [Candidatus Falkowbacteria bacterium RIFOXYB2_FULL_35_7]OGF30978.1 MAG: 50S ribosomal protein L2 [Candidatus Falkowbacteria bacterium RIFOXYC2_FULL_36_12]OGF34406.1 MAG: 50S ribosomal protein L2 [Candidatus Falkowbacteria bacterium RIFOXYA2_FULL_35_8]OGF47303.1 MAG: 50S ribosomal protein L2 [Candidatus Falkowbacteria bacterium RIFOXYD2_FULL_35_9]
MGIKVYKPISNARRQMSVDDFSDITKTTPEKSLIVIKKKFGGRNNNGRITVRHRGGGSKRYIRLVDFKRDKFDIEARVDAIEYDPNRNSRIALLVYKDGEKRYIVAPVNLHVGDKIISSKKTIDIVPGNATLLENIPIGSMVYNVELVPGKGGQIVRSAGSQAKLMAVEGKYAQLRLPSSEIRLVPKECMATVGRVSNPDIMHVKIGKAGRKRHMGIKPTVRGKAMNPVDHPHGGGEGSNPIGMKYPKTPWGKHALGVKTRRKKASDRMIVKRRKSKKK